MFGFVVCTAKRRLFIYFIFVTQINRSQFGCVLCGFVLLWMSNRSVNRQIRGKVHRLPPRGRRPKTKSTVTQVSKLWFISNWKERVDSVLFKNDKSENTVGKGHVDKKCKEESCESCNWTYEGNDMRLMNRWFQPWRNVASETNDISYTLLDQLERDGYHLNPDDEDLFPDRGSGTSRSHLISLNVSVDAIAAFENVG